MAEFKAVIADPKSGKAYKKDITGHYANALIGKKIGEDLDGLYVGLPGYKLQITGGSDKDGFPMRHDLPGPRRKGLLVSGGVGFHPVRPGMRKKKTVGGNTVSPDILQLKLNIVVRGTRAIMDGALLVIAANEDVPQPQTKEHLMALGIIGVNKIVIVQNKIDIVDPKQAEENYKQIQAFVKGTVAEGSPIVPVSAHHDVNLDVLLMMIQKVIPTRPREESKPAKMYVARSFDVNQPGIPPEKIVGGVLGGSLMQGKAKVGEEIEISPGRQVTVGNRTEWKNLTTTVRSLQSGGAARKEVRPGGLIAIGTNLDPVLTKADGLVGRVVGPPGTLPEVLMKMSVEVNLLERVVGVAEDLPVEGIKTSEPLMVSVGTATTVGVVTSARENRADMALKIPVVAELGQRVRSEEHTSELQSPDH